MCLVLDFLSLHSIVIFVFYGHTRTQRVTSEGRGLTSRKGRTQLTAPSPRVATQYRAEVGSRGAAQAKPGSPQRRDRITRR